MPELPKTPYCYALMDGDEVFYVGKGRGARMLAHERDARKGAAGEKCDRIRQIHAEGRTLAYRVLGEYETDEAAYAAERQWIARFPALTNVTCGGGGVPVSAKEEICRRAQRAFSRLIPKGLWLRALPPETAASLQRVFGSPEQFYDFIWAGLLQEAEEPTPNVITVLEDGRHEYGWQR